LRLLLEPPRQVERLVDLQLIFTRWTDLGHPPGDFVMTTSGHKPENVHKWYLLTDKQLTHAFQILVVCPRKNCFTSRLHGKPVENATAASY
jgi:hypothetical protein